MRWFLAFAFVSLTCCVNAQDAYHSSLLLELQQDYNLPSGDWLISADEANNVQGAYNYGTQQTVEPINNQPFTLISRFENNAPVTNPWDAGWGHRNQLSVETGDNLLFVMYVRSLTPNARVNIFAEDRNTFDKLFYHSVPLTDQWVRLFIPATATRPYVFEELACGLHLGFANQTIELGGYTVLNFGDAVAFNDLPNQLNNENYDGSAADAPWRAEAQSRIEEHRMVNLTIEDLSTPYSTIDRTKPVRVKLIKPDFGFGSAVTAVRFPASNGADSTYTQAITDLDGKGNGFSEVVFENDLKWDGWEEEWYVSKPELVNAVRWLDDRDITIRGHNLLWPGAGTLPNDVGANLSDVNFVKQRVFDHLETVLNYPEIGTSVLDWDVLNESTTNTDLADSFAGQAGYVTGREFYIEVFNKAHQENPTVELWLNDFVSLSANNVAGDPLYQQLKSNTAEIVNGADSVTGLGFQAHLGAFPNGIPEVITTMDDFANTFNLKTKITEFTLPTGINEQLAADYVRDFMTAVFSLPHCEGFLFWNFWDGATWQDRGANLYREDWTPTLVHETFTDLVFNQWNTDSTFFIDHQSYLEMPAFKGTYCIEYTCPDSVNTTTVFHKVNSDTLISIECPFSIATSNQPKPLNINIFPNPSNGTTYIEAETNIEQIELFDMDGKWISTSQPNNRNSTLILPKKSGLYTVVLHLGDQRISRKVLRQ